MKAALTVARELLRCRLQESGRDVLLECVAELLDAAASGDPLFCVQLPPQAPGGSRGGPIRNLVPPGAPQGFINTGPATGIEQQVVSALPLVSESMRIAAFGSSGPPPYRSQDGASSRTAWRAEQHGEAFGVVTPEAYVLRMVDRGYALEEDHGSFLGSSWEEEAPEAELFQEPHGSLDNYRVPLIRQQQAYANHGSQEVQVTSVDGCPSAAISFPLGGGHLG